MAKAYGSTYRTEHAPMPGLYNVAMRDLTPEAAAIVIATLVEHDAAATSITTSTATPQTQCIEADALINGERRRRQNAVELNTSVPQGYRTARPSRQRPLDGSDVQQRIAELRQQRPLDGSDVQRRIAELRQRTGRDDVHVALDISPTGAVRRVGTDDTSADLKWFSHVSCSTAIVANHRGLSFCINDCDDRAGGCMLVIAVEFGPPLPGMWVSHYNCNTAGGVWFATDASAKHAAMKIAAARNFQIDGDGHALTTR